MDYRLNFRHIGVEILAERKRKGLTQKDVADQVGTHVMTVSRIERGAHKTVSLELVARIARFLGRNIDELLSWEEPEEKAA